MSAESAAASQLVQSDVAQHFTKSSVLTGMLSSWLLSSLQHLSASSFFPDQFATNGVGLVATDHQVAVASFSPAHAEKALPRPHFFAQLSWSKIITSQDVFNL